MNQTFTALQIANALNLSKWAVQKALKAIAVDRYIMVEGKPAHTWAVQSLPESYQARLRELAQNRGCRSVEDLLQLPDERWKPKYPINEVLKAFAEKAVKLQRVLKPALERINDLSVTRQEIEAAAAKEFQKEFGYPISERQFKRLLDRTLERDRGFQEWHRVELYLDDNIGRQAKADSAIVRIAVQHRELDEEIEHLECRENPTAADREFLFHSVFLHFEKLLDASRETAEQRLIKSSLIEYLFSSVPALSKNEAALRRTFEIKYSAWKEAGRKVSGLSDQRRLASGNFRRPDFTEDKAKITAEAILHAGNEALAHRKLRERGELSKEFLEYYSFDPRKNKSYVPHSIREDITATVEMCGPLHRGPWESRMRGPYVPRDWSGVLPGDFYSGDDVTWNNYFFFYDDEGQVQVTRGECLLINDLRTGYPLDFILIAGKYNSRHIRSLLLKVHNKHGLPHQGFYFERGVWKSRFIVGDTRSKFDLHWRETEKGLQEQGVNLEVRNATTPRAKPIEGLFRILQERQRNEPGFVGFNERLEKMERMQDFLARVKSGKEDPRSEMLEMSDWAKRISKTLEEFMHDPQNGKMLDGRSPAEVWDEQILKRPQKKLADDCLYLLSTHKQPVRVRQEGIVLNVGKDRMLFCNERTGNLIGQDVLAFYNIDHPELLTVSDLDRKNFFTVKRVALPAMTATREEILEVNTLRRGHMKAARTVYGSIKHPVISTVSRDDQPSEVKELGRFHNQQEQQFKRDQTQQRNQLRTLQETSVQTGIALPRAVKNLETATKALLREQELRAKIAAKNLK